MIPTQKPGVPADWTAWFTLPRFILLLGLLIFAEYPEIILGTHSFFYRDSGLFTHPVAQYARESLWRGEIPLWNPLNDCGMPFLAQWNTTVCYPLSFLYLVLPLPWSLDLFCLGHLLLAGVAMYALAFAWTGNRFAGSVAGLAYALNGLMLNCLMWTSHLAALAWLPLVILCLERAWHNGGRYIVVAALVGATQLLSGAPEIILITWALAGTHWLSYLLRQRLGATERMFSNFLTALVLVCGLGAVQLLPFFELLQNSDRVAAAAGGGWAMPSWGWVNLFVPLFHSTPSPLGVYSLYGQPWTSSYYAGIGVLALALAAPVAREPRVRWLVIMAMLGLALAMGGNGILQPWLESAVPFFGLVSHPIIYVVLTVFALPLLAAFVLNHADRPEAQHFRSVWRGLLASGLLVLVVIVLVLLREREQPHPGDIHGDVLMNNGCVRAGLLVLSLGGVFALHRLRSLDKRRWLGLGLLFLLAADVFTHAPRQNPVVPVQAYTGASPVQLSPVPRLGISRAMVSHYAQAGLRNAPAADPLAYYTSLRRALFANCNLLEGVPTVDGYYSFCLSDYAAVSALLYEPTKFTPGLADFVGVAQITAPGELFEWTVRKPALPMVTAGQQPVFANRTNTLRAIGSPAFDPRRVVYLPETARGEVTATNNVTPEIVASNFTAQAIDLTVKATQSALLVVAQSYYPCWRAYVDNRPVALWRANAAFQAVVVPAGEHKVRLVYEDQMFSWGLLTSIVALLLSLWLLATGRWRGKPAR